MHFEVTILGSAGTHPGPGRACSGYLYHAGDTRVMVDCGNGSTSNLQSQWSFSDLDAIVVTHRHMDHCADLIGMFYALRFHVDGPKKMPLYAAPEVVDHLCDFLSADSAMEFREAFECHELHAGEHLDIGELSIDTYPSRHPVPTLSLRIEAGDRVIAYSSDNAGCDELLECAKGSDLFLCEATWQGDIDAYPPGIHFVAKDAAEYAKNADVDRLVLTHLLPSIDGLRSLDEAGQVFSGDLALAQDLQTWTLA